jgi:two-component system chemotaxis response regulator CheB
MPKDLEKEVRIAAMETDTLSKNEQVGNPSMLSCPECGGVLWELQDGTLLRFRCRVGHAFSADNVLAEQGEIVERALWVALKTLDEKVELSRRVAEQARKSGSEWLVQVFERRIQEAVKSAEAIRSLLC